MYDVDDEIGPPTISSNDETLHAQVITLVVAARHGNLVLRAR